MLSIIEAVFSLISFFILTSVWVFITSLISFYLKLLLKNKNIRLNPVTYSIFLAVLLEISLAITSILIMPSFSLSYSIMDAGILSGLEKGSNYSSLLSPISSIIGVIIGAKKKRGPRRRFRF